MTEPIDPTLQVRCTECRRFFSMAMEGAMFLHLTSNIVDNDPDGDYVCSPACLTKYAIGEWMDETNRTLRRLDGGKHESG